MKLEIVSLFRNFKGDRTETVVTCLLSSESGDSGTLTIVCEGDLKDLSDEDLILKVKDKIYDRLFPARAEKEAISDLRQEIDKINTESFAKLKEENNALLSKAVADLTLLITESINTLTETLSLEEEEENDTKESEGDI